MKPISPFWSSLQERIQAFRPHLQGLPYSRALGDGTLPLESYLGLLQALSVVHGVLEYSLDGVGTPPVSDHWTAGLRKGPLLEADLGDLYQSPAGRPSPSDDAALRITERIRLRSVQDPSSLLGYLIVLQEPLLNTVTPAKAVAKLFHLSTPKGLRYLSSFEDGGEGPWTRARRVLEDERYVGDREQGILEAAEEACQGLKEIFGTLFPLPDKEPALQAVGLNPEAGRHPVPHDPKEVEAAILGGKKSWEAIPYYRARYGQRGEKFTNSDGAWMVTLTEHDQEIVTQQIGWLAGVLAARGMPRVTMEVSLGEIHKALVDAVPEKEEVYRKLVVAADSLRTSRCAFLDEGEQDALARAFEGRVSGNGSEPPLEGVGRLLVSAVMDDLAGVKGTLDNLQSWMTDPVRFSQKWIEAVMDTLKAVREKSLPQS